MPDTAFALGAAVQPRTRGAIPVEARASQRPLRVVRAPLEYLAADSAKPVVHIGEPGEEPRITATYRAVEVPIRDGWPEVETFELDRQGFALAVERSTVADLRDESAIRERYYPEVERLVAEATGAARVLIFDHNIRIDDASAAEAARARQPVRRVHNDYTGESARQRILDLLPFEEAAERLQHRFAFVNAWRPIVGPVRRAPLALADARSIAPQDFVEVDLVYSDRVGHIYGAVHSPAHDWVYFPEMTTDEVLLIKCADSLEDGTARFTLHTAFDDPTTPIDAPARQSIEVRTIAFFDD